MTKRFSRKKLFEMRNNICIDLLIKSLGIPSKTSEGYLRFACPLCNQFNTATNPQTNLARCFPCERNFNTIDMVMIEKKIDFVDCVRFLKKYNQSTSVENRNNEPTKGAQPNAASCDPQMVRDGKHDRSKNTPALGNKADSKQPAAIGEVMKKILPNPKISAFRPPTTNYYRLDLLAKRVLVKGPCFGHKNPHNYGVAFPSCGFFVVPPSCYLLT